MRRRISGGVGADPEADDGSQPVDEDPPVPTEPAPVDNADYDMSDELEDEDEDEDESEEYEVEEGSGDEEVVEAPATGAQLLQHMLFGYRRCANINLQRIVVVLVAAEGLSWHGVCMMR